MKEPNVSRPVCSEIGNHHPIVEVNAFKTWLSVTETVDSDESLMKPDYLGTVTEFDHAHGSVSSVLLFASLDLTPIVAKVEYRNASSLDSDERCITAVDLDWTWVKWRFDIDRDSRIINGQTEERMLSFGENWRDKVDGSVRTKGFQDKFHRRINAREGFSVTGFLQPWSHLSPSVDE